MSKKDFSFIFISFFIWRFGLSIILFFSSYWLSLQNNFLGGGLENYLKNSQLWAWLNFDGEHYLTISRDGYRLLTYFYFPLYPLLVKFLALFFEKSLLNYALIGLFLSHVFFVLALIGLWKLTRLDYKRNVSKKTILLLLFFPTSFYFVCFYTESLFLFLTIWSFFFTRKKKWLLAAGLAGLASATRIVGIALLPSILVEWYSDKKIKNKKDLFYVFLLAIISVSGLLIYMFYLFNSVGDPLIFVHKVGVFGAQRSSRLIFLPQVFYRYIFKIIPALPLYWPAVLVTFLEFLVGTLFLIFILIGFFKIRISYWLFLLFGYIIPTLSGSFSSLPRYVIILFPSFLLLSLTLFELSRIKQVVIFILLAMFFVIATSFFVRGYWIS